MQYFTEQAPTHREAVEIVRAKYGDAAQILSHRTVRSGGLLGLFARELVEVTGYVRPQAARPAAPGGTASLEEEKRRLLEKARAEQARSDQALDKVLEELRALRESVESRPGPSAAGRGEDHPSVLRVDELLALNDFSESYRGAVAERLRAEFSLAELEDWKRVQDAVLEWIGDSVEVWREPEARGRRVLALVGPTGVGKTTTIAKLAAIYTVGIGGERPRSVRMITIDNYRIGARQQIETYGDIMGVPVSCVETAEDLARTLDLYSDADLVLVDTVGKSPRDSARLGEMRALLAACGPRAEVHLAVSATTKASDMAESLRQFEPFGYGAVVLTKLDETDRVGNAVSVLAEKRKPLSYMTVGQRVPQDIERVARTRILMRLEGFRPDRSALETRYGEGAAREGAASATRNGEGAARPARGPGDRPEAERRPAPSRESREGRAAAQGGEWS